MKYFCSDGPGTSRVYQIGVSNLSELSELSELLASTNTVLQRNSHLRASLTISAVKRSVEALLNACRRRQYIKKYFKLQDDVQRWWRGRCRHAQNSAEAGETRQETSEQDNSNNNCCNNNSYTSNSRERCSVSHSWYQGGRGSSPSIMIVTTADKHRQM